MAESAKPDFSGINVSVSLPRLFFVFAFVLSYSVFLSCLIVIFPQHWVLLCLVLFCLGFTSVFDRVGLGSCLAMSQPWPFPLALENFALTLTSLTLSLPPNAPLILTLSSPNPNLNTPQPLP
jgi:hypothetical protein